MASIVDVAAAAGVSRQTVSNVLNAPERVRPETRERVEAAIAELGYRPNSGARNLRSKRSGLIGVDLAPTGPDEVSPVLDQFVHALSEAAAEHGYHVMIFPRGHDARDTHLPLIETRTVDGFVLVDTDRDDRRAKLLAERSVPFVTFGRTGEASAHDVIDVDGSAGGRMVASHLREGRCTEAAFIGWPEGSLAGDARLQGFLDGWIDQDGRPLQVAVRRHRNRVDEAVGAVRDLVAEADRVPDAIVAVSDLLAVGVIRGLRSIGLQAGRDVRVVGFDDAPIAAHLDPPLTTVRQPLAEVAARVVQRFVARLHAPDAPVVLDLLTPELVVRDT